MPLGDAGNIAGMTGFLLLFDFGRARRCAAIINGGCVPQQLENPAKFSISLAAEQCWRQMGKQKGARFDVTVTPAADGARWFF